MKNNIKLSASFLLVVCLFFFLNSCGDRCDGLQCRKELGLLKSDTIFKEKNYPLLANKFNVFIESSLSMDGYVNGNTKFKTTIYRLIGQVEANVLSNSERTYLTYINSAKVDTLKTTSKKFVQSMSPHSFDAAGGNRAHSDIIELIRQVVNSTQTGTVSMFVSDCVYSPKSAVDIDKALAMQRTDMLNILKSKHKKNENFGVLLYRLVSDFFGTYYTKTDKHIPISSDGKRPYFVWFFGDQSLLAVVKSSLDEIMNEEKSDFICGVPGYPYLPYRTIRSDHKYHYVNVKAKSDSLFTFSFEADMNYLPLDDSYITNVDNYNCEKRKYYIKKIEKVLANSANEKYNYKYTICIKGKKNSNVTPTIISMSLKSMTLSLPQWITTYDDPKGTDYDNGYNSAKCRTFGLKSLVEGICDFYNEPYYVMFKIKIN